MVVKAVSPIKNESKPAHLPITGKPITPVATTTASSVAIATLLAVVVATGVIGFPVIGRWAGFDSFLMGLTAFTTIGYQEVHPLSHAGRVFNTGLIIAGVSLVFLGIGSLTQALLEFELGNYFGRRRMPREIGRLKGTS